MKKNRFLLCLLPALLFFTYSFGQKSADTTHSKVYVSTNTRSWFPQKRIPVSRMNKDSIKADYKRRTGKDLDDRFIINRKDTISNIKRKEEVNH